VRDIGIRWWDEKAGLMRFLYEYEHGERIDAPPYPPVEGGPWHSDAEDAHSRLSSTRRRRPARSA
jgi:hypothetical protein